MRDILFYIVFFVLIILSQVFIFDRLILPGGFVVSFYVLFLLSLPFNLNTILLLLIGFATGITIDAFNDTFGLHASAAVLISWLRPFIFKWLEPVIGYGESQKPNLRDMGWAWILKSYTIIVFCFHIWIFSLSFLRLIGPWFTLEKVLLSTLSTVLMMLVVQVLYSRKMNKNEL